MLRRLIARLTTRTAPPSDDEIARELRDHLELEEDMMANDQDGRSARRRFGNETMIRETTRDVWRWTWADQLGQDVRHGLRALRRSPAYSLTAAITLALGIGSATAMFSFTDAISRNPFPLLNRRLLWIVERSPECRTCNGASAAAFAAIRDRSKSMTDVAAAMVWQPSVVTSAGAILVDGYLVTPNLFRTIGAPFALGRSFGDDAGQPGRPPVIVLSYKFWQRQFASSSHIVDSTIMVGDKAYTVVGVLAKNVDFPMAADVYAPHVISPSEATDRRSRYLDVFARLAPGVTLESAASDANRIAVQLSQDNPVPTTTVLVARPIAAFHTDDVVYIERIADVAAFLVFLAACMSAANLCLARTAARRNELALRAALGVRRWRLARHLLTEASLVTLVGAAAGAGFATWAVNALRAAIPESLGRFLPGWAHMHVDVRALAFTLVLSTVATLAFALLPAIRGTRLDLSSVLSDGGRASTGGQYGTRSRAVLVVLEMSIALVLVTGATLLSKSVNNMFAGDPGVRRDHMLTLELSPPRGLTDSAMRDVYRRLGDELARTPGIRAAGFVSQIPLSNNSSSVVFTVPGFTPRPGQLLTANHQLISPDYMKAAGITLLDGRGFSDVDERGATKSVIVSKLLADQFWPRSSAIGKSIIIDSTAWTVIGVASDVRHHGFEDPPEWGIYRSIDQLTPHSTSIAIWTSGNPNLMRDVVQRVIARVEPNAATGSMMTMQEIEARHVSPFRMMASLLSVLAFVTVVIATVGLYGLIAYGVAQRVREIGLRVALGAGRRRILFLVGGSAFRLAGVGIVAGGAGALLFARLLGVLLYGVSGSDMRILIACAAFLSAVTLVAALVPAIRAARVSPMVAFRD